MDTIVNIERGTCTVAKSHVTLQFAITAALAIYAGFIESSPVKINRIQFFERDPSLSYNMVEPNQVPARIMEAISVCVPLALILLLVLIPQLIQIPYKLNSRLLFMFYLSIGLVQSILVTVCITDTIKVVTGRPRPVFFDQCDYQYYHTNRSLYYNLTSANSLGDYSKCRAPAADFYDSIKSFPSGHASISFAGMFYASFLLGLLFQGDRKDSILTFHNFIRISPLYLAGWISITRVQDMEHHVEDILGGALIGILASYIVWRSIANLINGIKCIDSSGYNTRLIEPIISTNPDP
jgi:diacylglycerol diphosphate phosphatase/phosphatidate phosphatase